MNYARKTGDPMKITLSEDRQKAILDRLIDFYSREFDENLSPFRARRLLDFFVEALGPPLYNQAVGDARAFMLEKLDDLDAEFTFPEKN